mmetsp:Transcript_61307/g.132362  ORF Transcript_61307/g.132362 Transcript_61307/m.132362 type:complete len:83 (+) Transcript_61307:813-1061(+)
MWCSPANGTASWWATCVGRPYSWLAVRCGEVRRDGKAFLSFLRNVVVGHVFVCTAFIMRSWHFEMGISKIIRSWNLVSHHFA